MKRIDRNRIVLILSAALMIALSGCFTLLKHPDISNMKEYSDYDNGDYHNCARCHGGFIQPSHYDAYYHTDPWIDYYYFPWWYDNVWDMNYGQAGTARKRGISEKRLIHSKTPLIPPEQLGTTRSRTGSSQKLENANRKSSTQKNEKTKWKNMETMPKHHETRRRSIIKSKPVKTHKTRSKEDPKKK